MTAFLVDLIDRPSLSRDENAVVQRIGHEMQAVGFDEVIVDGFGSVIGRVGDGPTHIVLDSHIDVVNTGDLRLWKSHPFTARIEDGIVYGRGASDNKAAIASMVYGVRTMKDSASSPTATPCGSSARCKRRIATGSPLSTC